jgi:hypothetical protein
LKQRGTTYICPIKTKSLISVEKKNVYGLPY